jgi:hypothetical protein
MVEAAQTSLSPAGIWGIVIAMTLLLAFWLMAIALADRSQARASGRSRLASGTGTALGGAWAGGSVAGARAPEIADEPAHEPIVTSGHAPGTEARGRHARDDEAAPQEETPTRVNVPAQPTAGRHARPDMPQQRSGEGDRAERSYAGQPTPEDEEQDR